MEDGAGLAKHDGQGGNGQHRQREDEARGREPEVDGALGDPVAAHEQPAVDFEPGRVAEVPTTSGSTNPSSESTVATCSM